MNSINIFMIDLETFDCNTGFFRDENSSFCEPNCYEFDIYGKFLSKGYQAGMFISVFISIMVVTVAFLSREQA